MVHVVHGAPPRGTHRRPSSRKEKGRGRRGTRGYTALPAWYTVAQRAQAAWDTRKREFQFARPGQERGSSPRQLQRVVGPRPRPMVTQRLKDAGYLPRLSGVVGEGFALARAAAFF